MKISRRSFMKGLAALAQATLLFIPQISKAAVEKCAKTAPLANPRVLIVSPTYAQAHETWKHMKHKEQAMAIGAGTALCGRQFDYIIVDEAVDHPEWLNQAVRTRLSVKGEWIDLKWRTSGFDRGHQVGVAGEFVVPGERVDSKGVRLHIPPKELTANLRYIMQAQLLDWYIETRGIV